MLVGPVYKKYSVALYKEDIIKINPIKMDFYFQVYLKRNELLVFFFNLNYKFILVNQIRNKNLGLNFIMDLIIQIYKDRIQKIKLLGKMRNQSQKQFKRNDNFMQSIYSKVAALKQNLEEYQENSSQRYNQNLYGGSTGMSFYNKNNNVSSSKLNFIRLNQQSKINRQNLLVNQRFKQNPINKMYSTTMTFYTIPQNNVNQNQKPISSARQRSLSTMNLISNKELNSKNVQLKSKQVRSLLMNKKYSSSKQLFSLQNKQSKQDAKQQKDKKSQITRSQNKILRLAQFLQTNDNRQLRNKKINSQQIKTNDMKDTKDVTQNEEIKYNKIKILDSDQNIDNNHIVQCLKQQQLQLQQNNKFKPIGSAKTYRKNLKNQLNEGNTQNLLNQKYKNKDLMVVDSKLSNYNKDKNLKKNYLQKGNRFRQMLYKKLLKSNDKNHQMVYMRQYDQWVPQELVVNNKKQLQTYMKLLLGQKKQQKTPILTLDNIDIMYY